MSKLPYLTKLVLKLAPKVGARVVVEPRWKYIAQIVYPNGVVRSFRHFALDLNNDASSRIARDKDFAKFFIKKLGYPVAPGQTVFESKWAKVIGESKQNISAAQKYAKKFGYPVIVKPNNRSQGAEVSLVWNQKELRTALARIFKRDNISLIEKYLPDRSFGRKNNFRL